MDDRRTTIEIRNALTALAGTVRTTLTLLDQGKLTDRDLQQDIAAMRGMVARAETAITVALQLRRFPACGW